MTSLYENFLSDVQSYKPFLDALGEAYETASHLLDGQAIEIPGWVKKGSELLGITVSFKKASSEGYPVTVSIIAAGAETVVGNYAATQVISSYIHTYNLFL